MKTINKSLLLVAFCMTVLGFTALSANASYGSYGRSYQYVRPYYQATAPVYNYSRGRDEFGGLIQAQLNLVGSLTFVPAPVHQYFYQYYPSYGYGY